MTSLDFVLYCLGTSTLLVSMTFAVRLIVSPRRPKPQPQERLTPPKRELDPGDELSNRLKAFQIARYASPIVRRQLDPNVGPGPALPRPPPPPSVPPRRPPVARQDDKVVPLPVKLKKEPDKED